MWCFLFLPSFTKLEYSLFHFPIYTEIASTIRQRSPQRSLHRISLSNRLQRRIAEILHHGLRFISTQNHYTLWQILALKKPFVGIPFTSAFLP